MMITFEIVQSEKRLRELMSPWHALWLEESGCIFQSYQWVSDWWTARQASFRLHVAIAWNANRLIAVLPLVIHHWRKARILEWAAQSFSDYCDALCDSPDILQELWTHAHNAGGFDIIRLKRVRPDAAIRPVLSRFIAPGDPTDICLQVTKQWLNGDVWFRSLNKKKRNNHSRGKRILAEMGVDPKLIHIVGGPPTTLIAQLIELKQRWIRANNMPAAYEFDMLPILINALHKLGILQIFVLKCQDKVIAASINVIQGDKMLAVFATYDPVVARASPGIMLMTEYTKWAFDHGITVVDYLCGEETYKFEFANSHLILNSFVASKTIVGSCLLASYRLWNRYANGKANNIEMPSIGSAYFTYKGNARNVPSDAAQLNRQRHDP